MTFLYRPISNHPIFTGPLTLISIHLPGCRPSYSLSLFPELFRLPSLSLNSPPGLSSVHRTLPIWPGSPPPPTLPLSLYSTQTFLFWTPGGELGSGPTCFCPDPDSGCGCHRRPTVPGLAKRRRSRFRGKPRPNPQNFRKIVVLKGGAILHPPLQPTISEAKTEGDRGNLPDLNLLFWFRD